MKYLFITFTIMFLNLVVTFSSYGSSSTTPNLTTTLELLGATLTSSNPFDPLITINSVQGGIALDQSPFYDTKISLFKFSPDDVGKIFVLDNGPVFTKAAERITNGLGIKDYISYDYSWDGTAPRSRTIVHEGIVFWSDPSVPWSSIWNVSDYDKDLAGYNINSFSLTINECTFSYEEPNPHTYKANFAYNVTFSIDASPIPIPSTLWLFTCGLFSLVAIQRKR